MYQSSKKSKKLLLLQNQAMSIAAESFFAQAQRTFLYAP
jgi:hypothetical protein